MNTFYDNESQDLNFVPVSRFATLRNKVRLHYKECGDRHNPTLLLIHDIPSNCNYFRNVMPAFSCGAYENLNFHVLAPDLPGFGATEVLKKGFQFTFDKLAETLVLLLETLSISTFTVFCVGQYGTAVVQKLAIYKKDNISAFIVQNGSIFNDTRTNVSTFDLYQVQNFVSNPGHKSSRLDSLKHGAQNHADRYQRDSISEIPSIVCESDNNAKSIEKAQCDEQVQEPRKNSCPLTHSPRYSGFTVLTPSEACYDSSTAPASPFLSPHKTFSNPNISSSYESNCPSMLDLSIASSGSLSTSACSSSLDISKMSKLSPRHSTSATAMSVISATELTSVASLVSFDRFKMMYQCRGIGTSLGYGIYNGGYSRNSSSISLLSISSTVAEVESNTSAFDPNVITLDYALLLNKPEQAFAQTSLFSDYIHNFYNTNGSSGNGIGNETGPTWAKSIKVPFLALWGTGDPYFGSEFDEKSICESYRKEIKNCNVKTFENMGHFALELAAKDIILEIDNFFKSHDVDVSRFELY